MRQPATALLWAFLLPVVALTGCGVDGIDGTVADQSIACGRAEVSAGRQAVTACLSAQSRVVLAAEYRRREAEQTLMRVNGGFDPRYYPAEVIASVHSIGLSLSDAVLLRWAQMQLEKLEREVESTGGYLIWPVQIDGQPTFGSNSQSRLVLSLALLHRQSPSDVTRRLMLGTWRALDRLPRIVVHSSVTGRSYRLPAYAFHGTAMPQSLSSRSLDPNQDAALAAAYAEVQASGLLDDPIESTQALATARHYFAAALDLATRGGCLPLADTPEYFNACDTRYNGFWLALMLFASQRLGATEADPYLQQQYSVLRPWLQGWQTHRTYPSPYMGSYPDPVEPMLLGAAVARFDDTTGWTNYTTALNAAVRGATGGEQRWPAGWLYPAYFRTFSAP